MNVLEIEGDYFRADQIASIEIHGANDSTNENNDDAAEIHIRLVGIPDPITLWFEKWEKAEAAQVKAVQSWLKLLT